MKGMGKAIRRYREEAGITQERLAELVDISTNHLGAIEREVKTPTMETFVKLLNVLGAEPNEVLKEVIPLTRMEHTSVVEGKLERLKPKKQESVLRMLDVIIEEMMKYKLSAKLPQAVFLKAVYAIKHIKICDL